MKLLKLCGLVVLLFIGFEVGRPYIVNYVPELIANLNLETNTNEVKKRMDEEKLESDVVSSIVEESRLKTLLTYLPFLGIQVKNVEVNGNPMIPSSEAVTFTYNSNLFALYQVDKSSKDVSSIVESLMKSNTIMLEEKVYVGYVASDLIVIIEEVNDLAKLIESVREVNGVLGSLGFEKVSLKFE